MQTGRRTHHTHLAHTEIAQNLGTDTVGAQVLDVIAGRAWRLLFLLELNTRIRSIISRLLS